MAEILVTGKEGILAQRVKVSDTPSTLDLDITEAWTGVTTGCVRMNVGDSREWYSFTGVTSVSSTRIQLTGVTRSIKKNASNSTDNDTATHAKDHPVGTSVILVLHSYQINEFVQASADQTISGDNTFSGANTFSSTSNATVILQLVTEAQRDALTGVSNGALLINTTSNTVDVYVGGGWMALGTATVNNASESVAGVVELGTVAEQGSQASTGGTGAVTVVQTKYLISSSAGAADENKIPILDATGKLHSSFMPSSVTKFGGDGSDGAVSSALTVTGSNDTYIVKNYTSFAPGNATVTITPTNCVLHIKVSGNADLTNTTFSFSGKGASGGSGGSAGTANTGNDGSAGSNGLQSLITVPNAGNGGEGGDPEGAFSNPAGGAASSTTSPLTTDMTALILGGRAVPIAPGAGGGGGGSGSGTSSVPLAGGAGGDGGAGGGCIILEVAGNLTFSSTTVDCSGADGSDGSDGSDNATNSAGGGGGGGGGAGGSFVCLYGGTLTGSVTPDVSGGAGGSGGTTYDYDAPNSRSGGAGGSGGGSAWTNSSSGTSVSASEGDGSAGSAGAAGQYLIAENTVFQ